ncbi:polysaccharide pyruvyl transferase family protein [Enterococcus sp. DIV0756]|uniref:polysaccharide pyruvyl transferase family protein n=1 Tax=Enterococcus sp. DIV0756 TaxID=2774636 RepID=UPI003F239242
MTKKIGILTFHNTRNAGAALQSFALQTLITNEGVNVKIVNYQNKHINSRYRLKKISEIDSLKELIKHLFSNRYVLKRQELFDDFYVNNQIFSREYNSKNIFLANKEFDGFIVGSDQVWNFNHTNKDWNYFLDFAEEGKGKFSYAASLGIVQFEKDDIEHWRKSLRSFDVLSLREKDGINEIKGLTKKEVFQVLDPTLLLTKDYWNSILPINRPCTNRYILIYTMADSPELFEKAKQIRKQTGFQIIYLNESWKKKFGIVNKKDFGPIDFLHFFRDAEYVLTSSFHGVAFSINFEKEFFFALNKEKINFNSRIENLTELVGLENRNIDSETDLKIDWSTVNALLEEQRKASLDVIKLIMDKTRE